MSASDVQTCHSLCHKHRQHRIFIEREKAELYVSNPRDLYHGGGGGKMHRSSQHMAQRRQTELLAQ
eukprot:5952301-Pleurochrysis_carterae.AAC.1